MCDLVKDLVQRYGFEELLFFPLSQSEKLINNLEWTFFKYLVLSEVMSNSNIRLSWLNC